MNHNKWYKFLKEAKEEQKLAVQASDEETALVKTDTADNVAQKDEFLEPVVTDDLSVYEIQIKVEVPKKAAVLLTQIKDRIRAVVSVTTVGTEDLEDISKLYDLRYLNLKFALSKGENVDHYIHHVLTPKLRLIRNLKVLHYGKVTKVR
jgi:hypothetical protein